MTERFQGLNQEMGNQTALTQEQQDIVNKIVPDISKPKYAPTLLHGVTSSGKTEIYKQLFIHTIAQKKSALLLLPEVTLACQFEQLLLAQLPSNIPIYSFHSGTSLKNKRHVWKALLEKKPIIQIRTH